MFTYMFYINQALPDGDSDRLSASRLTEIQERALAEYNVTLTPTAGACLAAMGFPEKVSALFESLEALPGVNFWIYEPDYESEDLSSWGASVMGYAHRRTK